MELQFSFYLNQERTVNDKEYKKNKNKKNVLAVQ